MIDSFARDIYDTCMFMPQLMLYFFLFVSRAFLYPSFWCAQGWVIAKTAAILLRLCREVRARAW